MVDVNWKDLIGRRILFCLHTNPKIMEAKVVEVSPSGRYVALRYDYVKHWHPTTEIELLEVLE